MAVPMNPAHNMTGAKSELQSARHYVALKVPRCPACGSTEVHPSARQGLFEQQVARTSEPEVRGFYLAVIKCQWFEP
jgi:hypothetical protein